MFHLRVLGSPSLKDGDGATPPSLGWGKPLALLALLSVRGEARRDEIVDLLWRDVDEAKARNAFRQALHRLRSALGEAIIPQDREHLRLVPGDQLSIDLRDFEAAAAAGRVDLALQLYQGDFLQDAALDEPAFDQWADHERIRIRNRYRVALEQAIAAAQADGRWSDAIAAARRLGEVAPLDEQAARISAQTYLSAGRRTEARDVLVQFGARLQGELGLPLPTELQAMLGRIDRMAQAAAPSAQAAPAGAPAALKFAGRERELSQLLSVWRSTRDESGTIALISGDTGIGKSRLVGELGIHARSLGRAIILHGREFPATAQVPFALIAEALRPLARAPGVVGASRHLLAEASRLLPELRDVVELPELTPIEDEASRLRFFEGIAALVDAAAYEQPLMIVLEDLHHSTPSTLELIAYLASRLAGAAVMFVLTARAAPAFAVGRLRKILESRDDPARARTLDVALGPIDDAAARAAVAAHPFISDVVRARVIERAAGNPGHLFDLLRRASQGDELSQPPRVFRAVLEERIDALSASHRRALLALALLGRPASPSLLAAMAHMPVGAAEESIARLSHEGLALRLDDRVEADAAAAEAVLESSGHASRAFLAGWIADALAADPATSPAELARLHAAAGRARETFATAHRAALVALRVGAWAEAVQYLQLARTVAAEPSQVSDVEGLLSALGAGKPRLAPAQDIREPVPSPAAPPAPASMWERWFPNWRMLFGAAVATLAISAYVMSREPTGLRRAASSDTLQLSEGEDGQALRLATGDPATGFTVSAPMDAREPQVSWGDSLLRLRPEIAATARALDGSPDGRWVLVALARDGGDGSAFDLVAVRLADGERMMLDTARHRSVVEAAWSPDGSRIAWVARVGAERQQEVFVSLADGSHASNVTRHPSDDYHIAWSGDGGLLGFTSLRDGNAELYAYVFAERRLWRLTQHEGQDDWARFSRSGRFVAFESTREGETGVYVMPALGGGATRVGAGLGVSVARWRAGAPRFIDRIRLEAEAVANDTIRLRLAGFDASGNDFEIPHADVTLLDTALARLVFDADSLRPLLLSRRPGLARVVATAGGWRHDTALVRIGASTLSLADGVPGPADWRAIGEPMPTMEAAGAAFNAAERGESGLLSRAVAPVVPGLAVAAVVDGAARSSLAQASLTIALVAPPAPATASSPTRFLRHASISWDADARRWLYAVGREVHSEGAREDSLPVTLSLRVERDSTVSFYVGEDRRWRSTVRLAGRGTTRAQAWIGGRAAGALRITRARWLLETVSSP